MAGTSVSFDAIRHSVLEFYSPDSDIWQRVNYGTASEYEVLRAFSYIPQMKVSRSSDGSRIWGYDYSTGLNQLAYYDDYLLDELGKINSNAGPGVYSDGNGYYVQLPANWSGQSGQDLTARSGATIKSSGATLATIADRASLAVTGVSMGAKLGVGIDNLLYQSNPNFWAEKFPTINPQTWPSLCESEAGQFFIRTLFGIPETGSATAYMPVELMAQTYMLLRDSGALPGQDGTASTTEDLGEWVNTHQPFTFSNDVFFTGTYTSGPAQGESGSAIKSLTNTSPVYFYTGTTSAAPNQIATYAVSEAPFSGQIQYWNEYGNYTRNFSSSSHTYNGRTFYFSTVRGTSTYTTIQPFPITDGTNYSDAIGYVILFGNRTQGGEIPGVTAMPTDKAPYGIPSPTVITGTTVDEVLQQLRQNYPDLFDGSITSNVLQDDGTIKEDEYVPVPWGEGTTQTDTRVITGDMTQTQTQVDDDTMVDITTRVPTDNPPDTGTGNQSPYVAPIGSASSLWAVYHPSQAQLNAFGAWLWSSDFVDQLKRLFNDPMQAVIGVHKVFAPIPTGGAQNIKCGYLDSGVSSPIVTSQYTEVNCGTVNCREYFGNVFDYDPHTKVSIYLPFIGVVPLKVSEVMRSSINVTYGVDVITGACLAKVRVERDGGGAILYSYGGSCACHYPISSGSYAGIISGVVTSAIGIAAGIATENPITAVGGAVAGLRQAHTEVQRSGGFTGCSGAMGPKKPYLIIDRPQTRLANDFELYQGKPANSTQLIGDCSGFVRAKEVHFSSSGAFDEETREIENLLKAGVLIN